jgi:phosphatidylglycerophosphate synthase
MLDARLRPAKDRLVEPIVIRLAPWMPPLVLTGLSLITGVAAGVVAAAGISWWPLGLWWLSRIADGFDGPVARARQGSSDLGGYLDILGDTVVYAAIPLGVATASGNQKVWIATGVMLATFYVNAVSWLFLAAVIEKRQAGTIAPRASIGTTTSIVMPSGLVEGTETIVVYSLLLAVPDRAVWWCWVTAVLVALTALQRVRWAIHHLR